MRKVNLMLATTIVSAVLILCGPAFAGKKTEPVTPAVPPEMDELDQQQVICLNMLQGMIVPTGNPLDLAIDGEGYFVLNNGARDVFTRSGHFAIDAHLMLVDPHTGYCVQRFGHVGEENYFQVPGDSNIYIPHDTASPPKATSLIKMTGNLNTWGTSLEETQTNVLQSNIRFTYNNGISALANTLISDLDQYTGTLSAGTITFSGYNNSGTALAGVTPSVDLTMPIDWTTTMDDVLTWLNYDEGTAAVQEVQTLALDAVPIAGTFTLTYDGQTTAILAFDATVAQIETALESLWNVSSGDITVTGGSLTSTAATVFTFLSSLGDVGDITIDIINLVLPTTATLTETVKGRATQGVLGTWADATLADGKLVITDTASGYSKSDFAMSWSGDGTLMMPAYFENIVVGGEEVKNVNIIIYDSIGGTHIFSAAFVRTNTDNMWDMVLTSMSGNIDTLTFDNRRINGIEFNYLDGSYAGLNATIGDTAEFAITFAHDTSSTQVITIDMGTPGQFNGLTEFAKASTAVAREQDGYVAGELATVSVSTEGVIVGAFTNGIEEDIATIQLAMFDNVCGLVEDAGSDYFFSSDESGDPVATQATTNGAGAIHDGALEEIVGRPTTIIRNAIERIEITLDEEWIACDTLEQMLQGGNFDYMKKDLIKAKQLIRLAIQHQEQSLNALEKSLEKLE